MSRRFNLSVDVVDLGRRFPALAGVHAPLGPHQAVGLTEQFTTRASDYARNYASETYFHSLLERAANLCPPKRRIEDILDWGAGAGDNSTFPAARLWPAAQIVATDLSPDLLALLHAEAAKRGLSERVGVVCVDAMKDVFEPRTFDLVVGSAILHQLIQPIDALKSAQRALRPGGTAVFFEPFELGYSIICMIFDRLIAESRLRSEPLTPAVETFLRGWVADVRRRLGTDKSAPIHGEIDDKWLFSRAYMDRAAEEAGFSAVWLENIHAPKEHLLGLIRSFLRLGAGATLDDIPAWAREQCLAADALFVESAADILSEAIIVFEKE